MTRVVASGYFDPLHDGHVEYLEQARALGDYLTVILNNDDQAVLKRGENKLYVLQEGRLRILRSLRCVDDVFVSIDTDAAVCKSLEHLRPDIFAKGGDRFAGEIPEAEVCRRLGIKIVDGLGAKINASSRFYLNQLLLAPASYSHNQK